MIGSSGSRATARAGFPAPSPTHASHRRLLAGVALALALWAGLYAMLPAGSLWLTYELIPLRRGTHLAGAVEFFLFETPKVLLLLLLVVFGVGVVRSFFTPERTRRILAGRAESVGNVLAAGLGTVTPFCSCSAVPLGVTFSFLIAAPMVNEVALALLFALFGWKVAAFYLSTGLLVAIVAGWIIGRLRLERHVEPWVYETAPAGGGSGADGPLTWSDRVRSGLEAVRDIVGRVWPYVVAGIAIGAAIHGWVPEDFMASLMGKGAWWAVPAAVLIGVPMYSNAAGIIPIVHALLEKGAALGTVLAFMMSVIALSLPETVILRKVLRPVLIAVFLGVVTAGIIVVGYAFNWLI
jgi:uncharacterized membrane protein YraQ (UPF0718 family)